jgi:predicted signal transduction protein with EAL and GGDEF domain
MILLRALTDDTDVAKVAQKIHEDIARPFFVKGHRLYLSISIGISVYPHDGKDVESLVKNADMAMYAAKKEGQGYRFFTEDMNKKALERMMLENNLRSALQYNQLVPFYQPLVNVKNQIIGMEVLLRWVHPKLGMISPSRFIPLAEETGCIVPIGQWVLHEACKQARKWHDMGYTGVCVSVNLSTRQLKEPDLIEMIGSVLQETGLAPNHLKLEVTESGLMENPQEVAAKMKALRARGVHFSIDDFGIGYSSLGYLKQLPIDTLKIDRSFVMDATTDKDDQEIIKTIIAMARNLSMDTVAEGVETKEQQEFLTQLGCHVMQGFYFGHPMPADQFEQILGDDQYACVH